MVRQVVLDTETTGLRIADGNRLVEIGCVELINRERTGNNLHIYFNPGRDSEEKALEIHGLDSIFLSKHRSFSQEVQTIIEYLTGAELIIHNADFDIGFLNHELGMVKAPLLSTFTRGVIDTLAMAKEFFPGKKNNLDALCSRFMISNEHRVLHGALLDAELLADVYIAMTRGQFGLGFDVDATQAPLGQAKHKAVSSITDGLPVIAPTAEELQAHVSYIEALEKESGVIDLWK